MDSLKVIFLKAEKTNKQSKNQQLPPKVIVHQLENTTKTQRKKFYLDNDVLFIPDIDIARVITEKEHNIASATLKDNEGIDVNEGEFVLITGSVTHSYIPSLKAEKLLSMKGSQLDTTELGDLFSVCIKDKEHQLPDSPSMYQDCVGGFEIQPTQNIANKIEIHTPHNKFFGYLIECIRKPKLNKREVFYMNFTFADPHRGYAKIICN